MLYLPKDHGINSYPWRNFSYNNSYQESVQMASFEAWYGRKSRTPLNWVESGVTATLISSKRLNNKSVLSRNIWKPLRLDCKAMQIEEGSPLSLEWVIKFI